MITVSQDIRGFFSSSSKYSSLYDLYVANTGRIQIINVKPINES